MNRSLIRRTLRDLLLLTAALLGACGQSPSTPKPTPPKASPTSVSSIQEDYAQVDQLIRQGQFDEAAKILQTLAETVPEMKIKARFDMAQIFLAAKKPEQALSAIDAALAAEPMNPGLLMFRGRILQVMGRLEEAEANYRQTIRLHPDLAEANFQLAALFIRTNRLVEASNALKICAQLNPSNAAVHYRLAKVYQELGLKESAVQSARRATELQPQDLTVHRLYQDLSIDLGSYEKILQEYQDLLSQNQDGALFHYLYGRILREPEVARIEFEIASQLEPNAFWYQYALGIQYYLERNYEKARQHMAAAAQAPSPEAIRAQMYLSLIDMADGDYAKAIEHARQLLLRHPQDIRVYSVLHQALLERQEYEEAEQLCQQLDALGALGKSRALLQKMETAASEGRWDRLGQLAQEAQAEGEMKQRNRQEIAALLAAAAMDRGDNDAALAHLQSASHEGLLDAALPLFWLGWLQEQAGNTEQAHQTWRRMSKNQFRWMTDNERLYANAARLWLGEMTLDQFEKSLQSLRYIMVNDYWALRGLYTLAQGRKADAAEAFKKASAESRGMDFPHRFVQRQLEPLD